MRRCFKVLNILQNKTRFLYLSCGVKIILEENNKKIKFWIKSIWEFCSCSLCIVYNINSLVLADVTLWSLARDIFSTNGIQKKSRIWLVLSTPHLGTNVGSVNIVIGVHLQLSSLPMLVILSALIRQWTWMGSFSVTLKKKPGFYSLQKVSHAFASSSKLLLGRYLIVTYFCGDLIKRKWNGHISFYFAMFWNARKLSPAKISI